MSSTGAGIMDGHLIILFIAVAEISNEPNIALSLAHADGSFVVATYG